MRCRAQSGAGLLPLAERPLGTTPIRTVRTRFAGTRQANRCVMHGAPDPALPACAYGGLHDSQPPAPPLFPAVLGAQLPVQRHTRLAVLQGWLPCRLRTGGRSLHQTRGQGALLRVPLTARLRRLPPARLLACFSVRHRRRSARPRMLPPCPVPMLCPRCPLRSSGCGVTKTRGSAPPVWRSWTTASTIAAVTPPPSRRATSGPPVVIRWCPCLSGPTDRPAGPEASHLHVAAVAMAAPPMRVPRERVAACWQYNTPHLLGLRKPICTVAPSPLCQRMILQHSACPT